MVDDRGWVRRKAAGQFKHLGGSGWCNRPNEEHILGRRDRSYVGDIWVCPECRTVWVAVLRPSMLDALPHWSVKWKRMCEWRAKKFQSVAERNTLPPQKEGEK